MKFFLDNNVPPNWAACLTAASKGQFDPGKVGAVVHLRDAFPSNTPDIDWINDLAGQHGWTIISGDAFRKKNGVERKVLRQSGLSVFVLQSSWASHPYWDKTSQLVKWWPRIVDQANSADCISMEVPWQFSGRFKQI